MSGHGAALVVFAKVPEKGGVKTRLETHFTRDQALAIYEAMLRDVLDLAVRLQPQFAEVSIYWASRSAETLPEKLVAAHPTLAHFRQRGEDLGMRMYHAIEESFFRGNKKVILIGCDSPTLPPSFLLQAVDELDTATIVFGPSEDGGYYLIGASSLVKAAFEGLPWGSSEVLARSVELMQSLGLRTALLPVWYDIDRPEDLERLSIHDKDVASNLVRVIREIRG
jgi:hypothetical protein